MGKLLRPCHQRAQRAVGRSEPGEARLTTEVVPALEAQGAAPAGDRRIDGHPLPGPRPRLDRRGELVAEDERARQAGLADPAADEPVTVGAAEPDRRHPEQHLAVRRLGRRLVVQADVARAVQPQHLHASRSWP